MKKIKAQVASGHILLTLMGVIAAIAFVAIFIIVFVLRPGTMG